MEPVPRTTSQRTLRLAQAHGPLLLLLVLAAVLRLSFLGDFPQVQADEGLWTNSTKNYLLFGEWSMDGRTHVYLSPVFHFLSLASFFTFGPSIEAARLVSAVTGVGTVWLIFYIVRRLTDDTRLALITATLVAVEPWFVLTSRWALIESTQVFFAVASLALLLGSRRSVVAGGLVFSVALLTKVNTAVIGLAFALFMLLRRRSSTESTSVSSRALDALLFGGVAWIGAGIVYALLYRAQPELFLEAFRFELEGQHFTPAGDTFFRFNRWGLAPVLIGRTTIELIRSAPLLFAFASVGTVLAVITKQRASLVFLIWAAVGLAFPLVQVFQPLRYFFLAAPAVTYLASLMISDLASTRPQGRRIAGGVLAVFVGFSLAYVSMNYVANRGNPSLVVAEWIRENTEEDDILMMAGYFATDVPNRAYAHYHFIDSPASLLEHIKRLEVDYVIWDDGEWPASLYPVLENTFHQTDSIQAAGIHLTMFRTDIPPLHVLYDLDSMEFRGSMEFR